MGSTQANTTPLFSQPGVYNQNVDVLRRLALGGVLQIYRAAQGWSVEQAAVHAGIGHMTWRRIEDGYAVRQKTYAAIDQLLDQPVGTVKRALGDDYLVAALARDYANADLKYLSADNAGLWVERFAKSTLSQHSKATVNARTSVALHPARAEGTATAPAVQQRPARPESSDVVLAAELLDRFARRQLTPSMETAMKALLDAMPDLLRPQADAESDEDADESNGRFVAACQ